MWAKTFVWVGLSAIAGFVLGRSMTTSAPANETASITDGLASTSGPKVEERMRSHDLSSPRSVVADAPSLAPGSTALPSTSAASTAPLGDCAAQLATTQARLTELEEKHRALDGDPIPSRTDVAQRFTEKALVETVQGAFRATKINGRVDTVDCGEFPCILYGRVNGDEELVAKLEDSRPFAAYDADIGVMLTWASGDHTRGGEPKVSHERRKPSEISLFAFAFYTAADKAKYGDALDRRIRSRTADLWNALSPDEP